MALFVSVLFIILSTAKFKLHPFLALLLAAFGYGLVSGIPLDEILKSITAGFGGTIGYIGIVIVAGTIIGTFLDKSGGAFALAESILRITGTSRIPIAMSLIGAIVSIPVFCDSGFVILTPLNKALSKRAKISLAVSAVALSLGLYATHTMVPPTPGPIAAAGILQADIGQIIVWGLAVSIPALLVGLLFACKVASKVNIDPAPDISETDLKSSMLQAPRAAKAYLPIVLPILLIVLKSIADLPAKPFGAGEIVQIIGFVGHPITALLIGVLIAFTLPKNLDRQMLSTSGWVGEALIQAATIILITGAGGAFGKVLQHSPIADLLGENLSSLNIGIFLPFILAAAIKSAQGSSTVAIITTASLMAPLMETLGLTSEIAKTLTVIAIGAGSMVVSHANDSYFWIVTQFSGMDVKTGYRLHTMGTLVQGCSAAVVVFILSIFLL